MAENELSTKERLLSLQNYVNSQIGENLPLTDGIKKLVKGDGANVTMTDNPDGGVDLTVEDETRTLATEGEVTELKAELTQLETTVETDGQRITTLENTPIPEQIIADSVDNYLNTHGGVYASQVDFMNLEKEFVYTSDTINLFDVSTLEDGYLKADGSLGPTGAGGWKTTPLIDIRLFDSVCWSKDSVTVGYRATLKIERLATYNENKTLIRSNTSFNQTTYTKEDGVCYIKFSYQTLLSTSPVNVMLESGTTISGTYAEFDKLTLLYNGNYVKQDKVEELIADSEKKTNHKINILNDIVGYVPNEFILGGINSSGLIYKNTERAISKDFINFEYTKSVNVLINASDENTYQLSIYWYADRDTSTYLGSYSFTKKTSMLRVPTNAKYGLMSIVPLSQSAIEGGLNVWVSNVSVTSAETLITSKSNVNTPYTRPRLELTLCKATQWSRNSAEADAPTDDSIDFILGDSSVLCQTAVITKTNAIPTMDLLHNDLFLKFKVISTTQSGTASVNLAIDVRDENGNKATYIIYNSDMQSCYFIPNEWVDITLPTYGYKNLNGTVDFSKITKVGISPVNGTAVYKINAIGTRQRTSGNGIVTFTFDDGFKSQLNAGRILAERGLSGTVFFMYDTLGDNRFFNLEDCKKYVNDYHGDLELHGYTPITELSIDELKQHWEESQNFLRENGLGDGKILAYPNGAYDTERTQLARKYFDSCRTISSNEPFETYCPSNIYRLRAVSSISSTLTTVATVKDLIDRALMCNAWLILVFHDIVDGQATTHGECSVSDFTEIVDYALNSGATIQNMREVLDSTQLT